MEDTTTLPRRLYQMIRLGAGDWLCLSNDGTELWRFHHHIDGAALGLCNGDGTPVAYQERTYWRAVHCPLVAVAGRGGSIRPDAMGDPWEAPWVEDDWYLPTRQAAINRMLAVGP